MVATIFPADFFLDIPSACVYGLPTLAQALSTFPLFD